MELLGTSDLGGFCVEIPTEPDSRKFKRAHRIARAAAAANEIETAGQKGCKVAIVIKVTFWLEVGDLRERSACTGGRPSHI